MTSKIWIWQTSTTENNKLIMTWMRNFDICVIYECKDEHHKLYSDNLCMDLHIQHKMKPKIQTNVVIGLADLLKKNAKWK